MTSLVKNDLLIPQPGCVMNMQDSFFVSFRSSGDTDTIMYFKDCRGPSDIFVVLQANGKQNQILQCYRRCAHVTFLTLCSCLQITLISRKFPLNSVDPISSEIHVPEISDRSFFFQPFEYSR